MAKMFAGKQSKAEEMAEAKAVKSGKVSPAEYARREKAEGDMDSKKKLEAKGKALASGKMSAEKYAAAGGMKKMANGGMAKYADGGYAKGGSNVRSSMKYGPGGAC